MIHVSSLFHVFSRLPQPIRFLLAGGWNTCFGFCCYWLLYSLFSERFHYLLILLPANVLAITNAFLCYKFFVFRTVGYGWVEYGKCWLVYGGMALVNAGLLWLFVEGFHLYPILANGVSTVVCIVISYFSHKYFSFRHSHKLELY